jgi:hypothetical protein
MKSESKIFLEKKKGEYKQNKLIRTLRCKKEEENTIRPFIISTSSAVLDYIYSGEMVSQPANMGIFRSE